MAACSAKWVEQEDVLDVKRWAELRRLPLRWARSRFKKLAWRFEIDRNTVRRVLRLSEPPRYERAVQPSKLGPFTKEIHGLLRDDPRLPSVRVCELIAPLGHVGGQIILDA